MDARRHRYFGSSLRLGGLVLIALASFAGHCLTGNLAGRPPGDAGALDDLLALVAFAAASAGSALLIVGPHLFDQIALSARWAPTARTPWPRI